MSSGSSGRYQSKLFNFFNQQSQRLTQQWENSIRHLQVATKWSVEALLYPLYQLFQPDELVGKRLQAQTPPAVDTPIQHVLELVQNLPSAAASDAQNLQNVNPLRLLGNTLRKTATRFGWWKGVENQPETNITKSLQSENTLQKHIPKVLGIGVHLENRNLVLVTNDNKILDVLTIQQQSKIAEKINSEIAKFEYSLKLVGVKKQQELLPEIDRILTKLTGKHNSDIKNFAESNINASLPSYPGKIFALLDTIVSNLEIKSLAPVKQRSQEIIQIAKNQFDIFLYGREQLEARGRIEVNSKNLETQTPNIPELIEAAINYFFGGRNIQQLDDHSNSEKPPIKPSSNQINQNHQLPQADLNIDNWLSYGDLFGDLEITANEENSISTANSLTEDTHSEILPKSKKGVFRNKKSSKVANKSQMENEIKNQRQIQPDWIETTATFLGYETHPLEQILAWLDHIMLWIEMIFMNMIYFFKGLLQVR